MARAASPLFVGVLEDVEPGNLSPGMTGPHVRIAFRKQGELWIPMRSSFGTQEALAHADDFFPSMVTWIVVFEGKQVGFISSRSPGAPSAFGDVGIQIITTEASDIPRITTGASEFDYTGNRARTRPLLLVSAPNFQDPDGWKPTRLSSTERALAVKEFRRKFPALEQCDAPEEEPIHMVPYADKEILIVKAYRSKKGEVLFGERLDDSRSKCGFFGDENFFDYWFVLRPHKNIQLLDSQMTAMDAADLGNSGRSAWMFHTSRGEDEDGYELFYDDFSKKASFHWTYH